MVKNLATQAALVVKNLPANAGDVRCGFDLWVGKIPWKRARQHTPVFFLGKFHGQRSLAGYGSCVHEESDMTKATKQAHMQSRKMVLFVEQWAE